jgi:hypothetical protein
MKSKLEIISFSIICFVVGVKMNVKFKTEKVNASFQPIKEMFRLNI